MLSPQICSFADIPLAAKTITSVFCKSYPLSAFLYNSETPLPSVPYGKSELLSIYLRQIGINGLVLAVHDDDQKCVGVAVWTGPLKQSRFRLIQAWLWLKLLALWLFVNLIYYRGAGMSGVVAFYFHNTANRSVKPSSTRMRVILEEVY